MSSTPSPALVPDRDTLPLKKRDQRPRSPPPPPPPPQQPCDAATFKTPYPYKSPSEFKAKPSSPFQPVPRRVPALYQPWMPTHIPARSKAHVLSTFREHHGWAEWREFSPLHPGWDFSHRYQHHGHYPGAQALHPSQPYPAPRLGPASLASEGLHRTGGYGWEQLQALRERGLDAERQSNGRNKGAYVRRRDRRVECVPRGDRATPPLLSAGLPPSPQEDLMMQHGLLHKSSRVVRYPVSGHSFERVAPGDDSKTPRGTYASAQEDASESHALASSERVPSSSPHGFPWLLPHFVAGSLIELRDGQLRRVEHLRTEDFLLGSLACPDLRLSCCTVQSISPSSSSSSVSRLLILLHDQQSQELVDVYVEYPFFVRGQGWSSCSPQRTARLCGLQCRQLSVGDVCLALTPVSTPKPPPSAALEPKTLPGKSAGERCELLQVPPPQGAPEPQWSAGGAKKEVEAVRRRHYSAPELRGPGTNCM